MANGFDPRATASPHSADTLGRESVAYDAGLRSYMLSVYNYTGHRACSHRVVAYGAAATGIAQQIFYGAGILNSSSCSRR